MTPESNPAATETIRLDVARAFCDGVEVAPASILVRDGVIVAAGSPTSVGEADGVRRLTHSSLTAVPGFVDCQINGFAGVDFGSVTDWASAGRQLLGRGVTTIVPTMLSVPRDAYPPFLDAAAAAMTMPAMPHIAGVHLEGPFLNPRRAGAHDPRVMSPPDIGWMREMVSGSPLPVAIWTLAPELPGALEAIAMLATAGTIASIGHSDATAAQVSDAVDRGARMVTHLFNAQSGMHHREPGVVGAALHDARLAVGVIADGVHVVDDVLAVVLPLLAGRGVAVSDAVAAAATSAAVGGAARVADSDTLAGGLGGLDVAFARVSRLAGAAAAVLMTASTPARLLGRSDLGRLAPGCRADVVLVDEHAAIAAVYHRGRLLGADLAV